jgi:hypothetical protein
VGLKNTSDRRRSGAQSSNVAAEAFALPVRLPEGLLNEALRPATAGDPRPPTVVSVQAESIEPWDPGTAERVREERRDGRVIWSIDVDRDRGFRLDAAGLVTIVVTHDGLTVRCAPASRQRGDGGGWSSLVTSQALPLAATLRHLEVMHASAVSVDGRALVFCAPAGVGKSSLAAALVLRGAGLLSDDAVAIDEDLVAHPSTGTVHLRAPELARLDAAARERLGIGVATRFDGRVLGTVAPAEPAPLGAVYLLERSADGPTVEAQPAVDPTVLLGSTFNLSVRSPQRRLRHLERCARIAAQVPIFRLRVTSGVDAVALAQEVLACR